MPRTHQIRLADIPYHVTQRGNGRQQVFFEPQDYNMYLDLLGNSNTEAGLRLC